MKINGAYFGRLSEEPRLLRTEKLNESLCEVCPLDGSGANFNFILSEETLVSPPQNMSVTDLKGGYLIKFDYPAQKPFGVLKQKDFGYSRVTAYYEGKLKISVETQNDFFIEELPFDTDNAEINCFEMQGATFVLLYVAAAKFIVIYRVDSRIEKVFQMPCSDFSYGGELKITEKCNDILKHTVISTYRFINGEFSLTEKSVTSTKTYEKSAFREELIPYLFFEEILCGGNIAPFVTPQLLENAEKLSGYLGEFIGVITPPVFINSNFVGLVYKKKTNLYYAQYYKTELCDGLISNIVKT